MWMYKEWRKYLADDHRLDGKTTTLSERLYLLCGQFFCKKHSRAFIQKGRLVKGISNTIPQLQVFELIICQPKGSPKFSK